MDREAEEEAAFRPATPPLPEFHALYEKLKCVESASRDVADMALATETIRPHTAELREFMCLTADALASRSTIAVDEAYDVLLEIVASAKRSRDRDAPGVVSKAADATRTIVEEATAVNELAAAHKRRRLRYV